jgi:hypothetical protein
MVKAADLSVFESIRDRSLILIPVSGDFQTRSHGLLRRASRAISAYSRNDRAATLRHLDELFAYMASHYGAPSRVAAQAALTGDRRVIDENAYPIVIAQIVLGRVRLDMAKVPSYAEWVRAVEDSVL